MSMRESFEKWCQVHMLRVSRVHSRIIRDWQYESEATGIAWEAYQAAYNMQQAEIDRLMLEFCPNEMTSAQKEAWANAQKRAPEEYQK